jgi:hypothetical protein
MNTLQKRSTTALERRLSILFRIYGDLERQFCELNKLRHQVRQAELSARSASCQAGADSFSEPSPHAEALGRIARQRAP